ncbi:hypothetical protein VNO78_16201 [Psophocarpus tetragonolobus]|uniref:Uncharacterized protein n=1 Tax=Psophocarpus tetragonolobus TaxID=3891 RepID=A0AAN9XJW2_PSOTE
MGWVGGEMGGYREWLALEEAARSGVKGVHRCMITRRTSLPRVPSSFSSHPSPPPPPPTPNFGAVKKNKKAVQIENAFVSSH